MTTILLLRHADNDYVGHALAGWLPGIHLNERGRQQAERLAERVAGLPVTAIYSSPLDRARETAEPLARRLGLEVQTLNEVGEVHLGEWEGREFSELEQDPLWREFNERRSSGRIPGGEMMLEVQTRMVSAFDGIRRRHPESTVVVISHGDPIRLLLLHYLGMPLDFIHRIEAGIASISTIRLNSWGPQVLRINDSGELL